MSTPIIISPAKPSTRQQRQRLEFYATDMLMPYHELLAECKAIVGYSALRDIGQLDFSGMNKCIKIIGARWRAKRGA